MNFKAYYLLLGVILMLCCSCGTSNENKVSITKLKEHFIAKDEAQFLKQFPKNFQQFNSYFGWNGDVDEPEELYSEANKYIDYFFELVGNEKYENKIINICVNGYWEADAINYFQDKTLNYIKEKNKFYLINDLDNSKAESVLFFLFDSPHPEYDENFADNLNDEKKDILRYFFEMELFDRDETNEDLDFHSISDYINNDSYFSKDIDINNDGVLDKIVCHNRYQGEELVLFISEYDSYEFALKTRNFSDDGGNQVTEIKQDKNGFVIVTSFPDRGFYEEHYYISYQNSQWVLTNIMYKTKSSNQEDAFIYLCNVEQNINLSNVNLLSNLSAIPDETDRDKTCIKEKIRA